eukprot:gene16665-16845_t
MESARILDWSKPPLAQQRLGECSMLMLRVVFVFRRGVETAEIRTALGDDRGEVDEDAEASSALFEESEGRLLGVRDLIEVIAEGVDATDVDELLVLVGGCCFWLPDLLTVTGKFLGRLWVLQSCGEKKVRLFKKSLLLNPRSLLLFLALDYRAAVLEYSVGKMIHALEVTAQFHMWIICVYFCPTEI